MAGCDCLGCPCDSSLVGFALYSFRVCPALWAQTPIRLLNEAEAAILRGQPDQALTSIDRFLDEFKQGTITGTRRAQELDRAGKILAGLRERDSQSVRAGYLLGEIRFLQNQFKETLEILNPIRSANLKNADYFSLASIPIRAGRIRN